MSNQKVRVRFAPSPTGLLHIGGLRTALYNFLFARHHEGDFILRIEDTDRGRYVEDAEEDILRSLEWAGLSFEEGPGKDGPHVPYYQSQRSGLYAQYAQVLLDNERAYYAFDTPEELEFMRTSLQRAGNPAPKYDAITRQNMRNSLTLSEAEVRERIDRGDPYVVRLKVVPGKLVQFNDLIRGSVSFDTTTIDDQVLIKSDGMPTYHMANIVDDHAMGITHVIRGEEWLPSTPKHILLYQYLGWTPPTMAHLPLIMSPTGGKLSKRNAEKMGIPVSVRQYREEGYEPEALINFLALLGWNPGTEQEHFTLDNLTQAFSVERVGSSGVQFDIDKLRWFNEQFLRRLPSEELLSRVRSHFPKDSHGLSEAYQSSVVELVRERLVMAADIASYPYFFADPKAYDEVGVRKRWKDDSSDLLGKYAAKMSNVDELTAEIAEALLREVVADEEKGAGRLIHPTRLAVSGVMFGPSLFQMMEVLGRDTCLRRINNAIAVLG